MEKEELLEKIEKRHEINTESGDTLIWVTEEPVTMKTADQMKKELERYMSKQNHIVIDNLESIYRISAEEE